jgi:RNA 3'-terminal phosphate cyclase (ATP)
MPSRFKGTLLLLVAEFQHSQCCYYGLGARGKPAERVADEAVEGLDEFLATDGAIDQYLADQLVLPLACAPGISELRTAKVTQHLVTNADIVRRFVERGITILGEVDGPGVIRIE